MRTSPTSHKYFRIGFSMVELIAILSIIGILAAIGAPAISRIIRHNRVNRAATVIASDLQNAFAVAARQREPVRIQADAATRSYQWSWILPTCSKSVRMLKTVSAGSIECRRA